MPSFRANRQLIRVNGAEGRFWDTGDLTAPTIVLLASPLARGQAYLRTAQKIAAQRFRVILVEMPGTAGGSRLDTPWSFHEYSQWVAAFLERLALHDLTLIGHSNAGATALVTAADHPARIAKLILVDSTGARPLASIPRVILNHTPEFPFEYWFNWRAGPDVFYNMLVHSRNFWAQVRAAVNEVVLDHAHQVRAQTLIAWGNHDHTVPTDCAHRFAQAIPSAQIYWSPEGRHDWIIEHPDEFAATVKTFVSTGTAPRAPD